MKYALALWLVGCGGGDQAEDSGPVQTVGSTNEAAAFAGRPLDPLSSDDCPKLTKPGDRTFVSNGVDRDVLIRFPKDPPPDLPVIFFWHGLGDTPENVDRAFRLTELAEEQGAVVVIPRSVDPFLLTWNVLTGGDDLVLFDDMRTCLSQELDVDLSRISTTGFSYGALFSTYLVLERGDALSTALTLSGGTDAGLGIGYRSPAWPLPVLVAWGGDGDVYNAGLLSFDFAVASETFTEGLTNDGHPVLACDHGLGHNVPADLVDLMAPWLLDHRFDTPSPYAAGWDDAPSYCTPR